VELGSNGYVCKFSNLEKFTQELRRVIREADWANVGPGS
jgi:hypothetical protein